MDSLLVEATQNLGDFEVYRAENGTSKLTNTAKLRKLARFSSFFHKKQSENRPNSMKIQFVLNYFCKVSAKIMKICPIDEEILSFEEEILSKKMEREKRKSCPKLASKFHYWGLNKFCSARVQN